ncbi:MAG TPA: gephyrin-like molybdotransferase Glp [Longimicrobiales bacterium]|nr:gephyrin-like molybdotransferase Glp [Longimicrobiales bacterium]
MTHRADWIDADEALARVLTGITTLGTEEVALADCAGRVLAEAVRSPIEQPAWDNSGMDGYAVRAEDIEGARPDAPRVLQMIEDVPAGAFATRTVERGQAIRIMTGAAIPGGADSVVRLEHTQRDGDRIRVLRADDAHRNIRPRGEDLRTGDVAVEAGRALRAAEVGVLAMVGAARVRVHRRPVTAILSTGDEIVELDEFDEVLAGRRIANSNGPMLAAAVRAAGGVPLMLGVAADRMDALEERIDRALAAAADALVISAGASMGEHDLVKHALDRRGFRLAFWRARVRPGSPLAFGTIPRDNAAPLAVFSLPGNPVSALVTCELFVKPALRRMQGRSAHLPRIATVRVAERVRSNPGLARFLRVRLDPAGEDGLMQARLTGPQGSGVLTSAARADALLIVPEDVEVVEAGSAARAVLLSAADDAQEQGSYVN